MTIERQCITAEDIFERLMRSIERRGPEQVLRDVVMTRPTGILWRVVQYVTIKLWTRTMELGEEIEGQWCDELRKTYAMLRDNPHYTLPSLQFIAKWLQPTCEEIEEDDLRAIPSLDGWETRRERPKPHRGKKYLRRT